MEGKVSSYEKAGYRLGTNNSKDLLVIIIKMETLPITSEAYSPEFSIPNHTATSDNQALITSDHEYNPSKYLIV